MRSYEKVQTDLFDVIEPALEKAGYQVVDGYDNQIIIRAKDCGTDIILTLSEAD